MFSEPEVFLHVLYFTVKENLALLFLHDVSRLRNSIAVALSLHLVHLGLHSACSLLVSEDSIFLLICGLGVRLAVEKHLVPAFVSSEYLQDFLVVIVVSSRRVHKCSIPQTVLLESRLVRLTNVESGQGSFILQFQAGF